MTLTTYQTQGLAELLYMCRALHSSARLLLSMRDRLNINSSRLLEPFQLCSL